VNQLVVHALPTPGVVRHSSALPRSRDFAQGASAQLGAPADPPIANRGQVTARLPSPLIYNCSVETTNDTVERTRPEFALTRCRRCDICAHYCPKGAIRADRDGTPYLAHPGLCTLCGLCEDMCPDRAVCLSGPETIPNKPSAPREESAKKVLWTR
jgi:2-oxoglutarate ferredoxin oxidoreductase subunit delta